MRRIHLRLPFVMNFSAHPANRLKGLFCRRPRLRPEVQRWMLALAVFLMLLPLAMPVSAQENAVTNSMEEIPPLRPPRDPLPPTFWEVRQRTVMLATAAGVLVILAIVFLLMRPRRVLPTPPEVVARQALERWRPAPEEGLLLSRVSQILRQYLKSAFDLAPGESTTAEFCGEIAANERIGLELANAISTFLRRCDERKFARAGPAPELGAVARAFQLIDVAETRRAVLRAAEKNVPPVLERASP
jgi:hypothetical protein